MRQIRKSQVSSEKQVAGCVKLTSASTVKDKKLASSTPMFPSRGADKAHGEGFGRVGKEGPPQAALTVKATHGTGNRGELVGKSMHTQSIQPCHLSKLTVVFEVTSITRKSDSWAADFASLPVRVEFG